MVQTTAILLDAYRELNSRKLFWITLVLSGVVVAAFAFVGINSEGLRIFVWDIPVPMLNTNIISEEVFYKTMFVTVGIEIWLTWVAAILALVSTAGIFPDLIGTGSIDVVLSKPLGRLRLFLTKYCASLLFVGLQVAVFCCGSFLVIGIKGGAWEPALFLAIPVVLIFFSYLYSICVLFGLLTKSTIASLMLTLLVWFLIFGVHATESGLLAGKLMIEQRNEALQRAVLQLEDQLTIASTDTDDSREEHIERLNNRLTERREEFESSLKTHGRLEVAHDIAIGAKTILPKTAETVALLERWLIDMADLPPLSESASSNEDVFGASGGFRPDQERLQRQAIEEIRGRSITWVMGTSLLFEAVILALGAWRFCRRDF